MNRNPFFLFVILCLINFGFNKFKIDVIPYDYIFWANCNFWLHSLPILHFVLAGYKKEIFPFIGLLGGFLMISFSLPIYFINPTNYQLGILSVEALKLSFWAYTVFYFFYFVFRYINIFKLNPYNPIHNNNELFKARKLALVFLMIHLFDLFVLPGTSLHHIAEVGVYIYLGTYLTILNIKSKIQFWEKWLFYLVLIYEYFSRAFNGLIAVLALLTVFLILIDFFTKRSLLRIIVFIVPFMVLYLVMAPIKSEFRQMVWLDTKSYSMIDRFILIKDLYLQYKDKIDLSDISSQDNDRNNFFWRFSYQASAFSFVLQETPDNVPYYGGKSYSFFSKFIPRFIWPGKPREDMGYIFGTRYSIISHDNTTTSMNLPILTEMYMNFGKLGIFIGMILLSLVYLFLNNYLNQKKISMVNQVYSISILFAFVNVESNFTLTFGNLPLLLVSIYLITKKTIKFK